MTLLVIPAKAGISGQEITERVKLPRLFLAGIPACAGMTV
jgi:hypothetical protein